MGKVLFFGGFMKTVTFFLFFLRLFFFKKAACPLFSIASDDCLLLLYLALFCRLPMAMGQYIRFFNAFDADCLCG